MIRLTCKKRKTDREKDTVTISRGERTWVFQTWNQRVLPHELVHYAVEHVFGYRGFVRLIADGATSEQILALEDSEVRTAENVTNAYQYELWGLVEPDNDQFLSSLRANGDATAPEPARIEEGRALLRTLSERWSALPHGEHLELELADGGAG